MKGVVELSLLRPLVHAPPPPPCRPSGDQGHGSGHRLLVFAQMKGMLDLVERDVLLPAGINFLRLDGSLEATARYDLTGGYLSVCLTIQR